ncbi:uncharacterized protein LOC123559061 isoform X2 [Mercenaria mercenaria]|uniref:uncharacterized protein LOC123559061 isoform X2 n=1 Tax=Mercenaria mercenaria TaxID=6596 RepID=UPI00234ECD9A|nr:uncharacterized protein LOC123559061 isoform X2 [Mercenaria mercenaria]
MSGCCCSDVTEEEQSLNPSSHTDERQPVRKQPMSQKYITGKHETRNHESHELSTLKDRKDILTKQLQDLQSRSNKQNERLSAAASAKLTDENPNIADLSDMNRPTKISEQFAEIYDNEWTDAFEALTNTEEGNKPEEEACKSLLHILTTIYSKCYEKSKEGLQEMTKSLVSFNGMDIPSKELLKMLKDDRKKNYSYTINKLREEIASSLQDIIKEQDEFFIPKFIEKCTTVCWLMAIQDPPVSMDVETDRHDEELDTDKYKHYTQSGRVIDYIVWPVLYLYEGGNILNKGIAQGKKSEKNDVIITHF